MKFLFQVCIPRLAQDLLAPEVSSIGVHAVSIASATTHHVTSPLAVRTFLGSDSNALLLLLRMALTMSGRVLLHNKFWCLQYLCAAPFSYAAARGGVINAAPCLVIYLLFLLPMLNKEERDQVEEEVERRGEW